METNQILLSNLDTIRKILENNENYRQFITCLCQKHENSSLNSEYLEKNKEETISSIITNLPTKTFLEILQNTKIFGYESCIQKIKNTREKFLSNLKDLSDKKVKLQPKFPFWPENTTTIFLKDIWTPLQIRYTKDSSLFLKTIFNDTTEFLTSLKKNQRVLIYGDPGIGKSYHSIHILRLWAQNYLSKNSFIFYLKLIDVVEGETLIDAIVKQISTKYINNQKGLLKHYLECEGENFILLLDGFDELMVEESEIKDIINGIENKYKNMTIIVWTRKWKVEDFLDKFDICLEIIGFSNQQKFTFFKNFFQENKYENPDDLKSTKLYNYLENEKSITFESCHNPLFATITAAVWDNLSYKISSDSIIIEEAINILFNKSKIKGTDDVFDLIGEKCLDFILLNKQMEYSKSLEKWKDLGGLIIIRMIDYKGEKKVFNFIHFSFHEFFTAKYLVSSFKNNKKCILDKEMFLKITKNNKILLLKNVFNYMKQLDVDVYKTLVNNNKEILQHFESVDEEILKIFHKSDTKILSFSLVKLSDMIFELIMNNFHCFLEEINFYNVILDFGKFFEILKSYKENNVKRLKIKYSSEYFIKNVAWYYEICCVFPNLKKLHVENLTSVSLEKKQHKLIFKNLVSLKLRKCYLNDLFPQISLSTFPMIETIDFTKIQFKGKYPFIQIL